MQTNNIQEYNERPAYSTALTYEGSIQYRLLLVFQVDFCIEFQFG